MTDATEVAPKELTSEAPATIPMPSDAIEEYKPPIDESKIPPKIKSNVAARKAVTELLELAESEPTFCNNMNQHFWKVMLDECIKRGASLPVEAKSKVQLEPLDDRKTRILLKERMESGQFLGMSVGALLKKGQTAYLKDFATTPSRFQKQLLRLFARGDKNLTPQTKQAAKKEPKEKKEPMKKAARKPEKAKKVKKASTQKKTSSSKKKRK